MAEKELVHASTLPTETVRLSIKVHPTREFVNIQILGRTLKLLRSSVHVRIMRNVAKHSREAELNEFSFGL
ncbi:hypothetical protein FYZ45_00840 [Mobiluncus mulieris]|uniref:Uncharacterized protein n=1 Tax=Mobiluncus mulieris TaxID=2052 RepID=A0ABD4TY52_9ACTO|nr:hypothetical protein [Mobiluncus mulieris]MCU9972437.1 hypothetical protein [Mobiluncus mulieris]MCU9996691.1 hypothetical protein [Mobiluncus mulieris]MCV0003199.1 hypothetical protein [Mobiluncus mulieris]MCV0008527.1 hypothetical protein [Mobiluncus mulieris]